MKTDLHWQLIHDYLSVKGASITAGEHCSRIQLTEELDRTFMNRPFYWHYRDQINMPGEPLTILLTMDPALTTKEAVPLVLASIRNPIYMSMAEAAQSFTSLATAYEKTDDSPLLPWLWLSVEVTSVPPGSVHLISKGICMQSGKMQSQLPAGSDNLSARRPDHAVLHQNILSWDTALNRLFDQISREGAEKFKEGNIQPPSADENSRLEELFLKAFEPAVHLSLHACMVLYMKG